LTANAASVKPGKVERLLAWPLFRKDMTKTGNPAAGRVTSGQRNTGGGQERTKWRFWARERPAIVVSAMREMADNRRWLRDPRGQGRFMPWEGSKKRGGRDRRRWLFRKGGKLLFLIGSS